MVGCTAENRLRYQREDHIGVEKSVQNSMPHLYHLTPKRKEIGTFPNARQVTAFHHCNHCENAPCLDICPTGAITRRPGGEVVINRDPCSSPPLCSQQARGITWKGKPKRVKAPYPKVCWWD